MGDATAYLGSSNASMSTAGNTYPCSQETGAAIACMNKDDVTGQSKPT